MEGLRSPCAYLQEFSKNVAQSVMNLAVRHCPLSVRHDTFCLTLYIFILRFITNQKN